MTELIIISAAVIALGAWLRWAVQPVVTAFRAGLAVGREERESRKRQMNLLIRTLGYATGDGRPEVLDAARPGFSAWYYRPMPLAVLTAILRPGRAVCKLRSADDAIGWTLDAMVAQHRKHNPTGPQPVLASA